MEKQLELVFLDQAGRNFVLRIDDPKIDLQESEILAQMEIIRDADIFASPYGDIVSIVRANIVSKEVETYSFA